MATKFVDFGGERIEVPADSNPRTAGQASMLRQKMLKERKASGAPTTSPRPAPRPQATRTPGNSQRASSAPSRASQDRIDAIGRRVDSGRAARAGDPRTQSQYNDIFRKPTQARTANAPAAYKSGMDEAARSAVSRVGANRAAARAVEREDASTATPMPSSNRDTSRFPKMPASLRAELSPAQKTRLERTGTISFRGQRYSN